MDVSDIFKLFLLGEVKGESEAPEVGRVAVYRQSQDGGEFSRRGRGRGAGRVSATNWGMGGGGLNIFFVRGRNVHQVILQESNMESFVEAWQEELSVMTNPD